jgi:beta-1,4-mannosyl-glycoprotein beta-1,4-N-acetylglucosaminyltransferase
VAVFDCFTFFNEFDVLRLRLTELQEVVDRFVAVEAAVTFAGDRKPCSLTERVGELGPLARKLEVVCADDLPIPTVNRWPTEIRQRNAISAALASVGAQPHDTVLISDVDEIPRAEVVARADALLVDDQVLAFDLDQHWYRLDLLLAEWRHWPHPRACRRALLDVVTPSEVRAMFRPPECVLPDAGWHFSYLAPRGGAEDVVRRKLASFSHHEIGPIAGGEWPKEHHRAFTTHMDELLLPVTADALPRCVRTDPDGWERFRQFPRGPSGADVRAFHRMRTERRARGLWRKVLRPFAT